MIFLLHRRRCVAAAAAALAVGLLASPDAFAGTPADAGALVTWGTTLDAEIPLPEGLNGVAMADAVALGTNSGMYLTAAGTVLTQSSNPQAAPPAALASERVRAIDARGSNFAAVTAVGNLVEWPSPLSDGTVGGLTQVSLGSGFGVGLKADKTVVAWGNNSYGQATVPTGLDHVVKVEAGNDHAYALRDDGTVVGWGRNHNNQISDIPTSFATPGTVKDIAARNGGGLAVLTNGNVVSWGNFATYGSDLVNQVPSSLDGVTVTAIAAGGASVNLAVTADGAITAWGASVPSAIPADLDGRTLSAISVGTNVAYAIQRKVMPINASTVAGNAKQGQKLTGSPGTFSGEPTVSYEWLANGAPIAGATSTTLTLGSAQVGKKISFRTVATTDTEVLTSDSTPTAIVVPLAVASKTTIAKPKVKKKTATITVKVTRSGGTPTGKVKITVKRGSKTVYNKSVTLKKGVAKITIKKLKKGKHKVSTSYAGDTRSKASTAQRRSFGVH